MKTLCAVLVVSLLIGSCSVLAQTTARKPKQPKPPDPRVLAMSEEQREAGAYLYVKHSAEYARSNRMFTGGYILGVGAATAIMMGSMSDGDVPGSAYLLTMGIIALPGIITLAVKTPEENAYASIQEGRIEAVSALGMWAAKAKSQRQLNGGLFIGMGLLSIIMPAAFIDDDDMPMGPFLLSGAMMAAPGIYLLSVPSMPERMFDDISPSKTAGLNISINPTITYDYKNKAWGAGACINF